MMGSQRRWWRAVGAMIGATVGIGVFGLPYAFSQVGFWPGLTILVVLGCLVLLINLLYAEVTIRTPGHRRLTGLAEKYLGHQWKTTTAIVLFVSIWGGLTATGVVAGEFMQVLLGPIFGGTPIIWSLSFFALEAVLLLAGLRKISRAEVGVVSVLLILYAVIIVWGLTHFQAVNLSGSDWGAFFLPYGVVLFALSGLGIIPEMHEIFGEKEEKRMYSAIIAAMTVIVVVYALFALAVVGVTGLTTSPEAIYGLGSVLGTPMLIVGSLLGVISTVSIFLIVGVQIKDTLIYDYKKRPLIAWFLTMAVPVGLFLIGAREFIQIISFCGAVLSAAIALIVVLVFEKLRRIVSTRKKSFQIPKWISVLLIAIFVVGAVVEIASRFFPAIFY